jgi:hypothetical protein
MHPAQQTTVYQDLSQEFTAIDVPIWEALAADYARRQGLSCAIHDISVAGWNKSILSANEKRRRMDGCGTENKGLIGCRQ